MEAGILRLLCFFGLFYLMVDGHGSHRFGYTRKDQKSWHEHSEDCGGELQSPISIVSHKAVPRPLPALEMLNYHNLLPLPVSVTNTGHSVSLKPEGNYTKKSLPQVFGALLPNSYELESLHFHWGHHNSRGSEHIMNGIRFPVEMHIIHRNMKYEDVNTALAYEDGLTVLAFFFQVQQKENIYLRPLLSTLNHIRYPMDTIRLNRTFTLASLLDTEMDVFYTYRGSLTTPPCSEAVTWIVFPDPLPMSFRQIKKFRRLYSSGTKLVNNYRLSQKLNNRVVYVRNMWKNNKDGRNNTRLDSVPWLHV